MKGSTAQARSFTVGNPFLVDSLLRVGVADLSGQKSKFCVVVVPHSRVEKNRDRWWFALLREHALGELTIGTDFAFPMNAARACASSQLWRNLYSAWLVCGGTSGITVFVYMVFCGEPETRRIRAKRPDTKEHAMSHQERISTAKGHCREVPVNTKKTTAIESRRSRPV